MAMAEIIEQPMIERHPLEPFLPDEARLLMLGSFPPPRRRWSMEFFYPNLQNDMWRIMGYLATGDKTHFLNSEGRFDRARIEAFCRERGLAIYDAAQAVIRLKQNASDDALQVVEAVDLAALLRRIPRCRTLLTTGGRASEVIASITGCEQPPIGASVAVWFEGQPYTWWRMPSSSRAYPKSVEWKAEFYRKVFAECAIIGQK